VSAAPPGGGFRRVLLALGPGSDYRAALAEAIRLAASLEAELSTLFVEDTRLLDASRHSFARRYTPMGAGWQQFGERELTQAMRSLAEQVRRAVAEAAARDRLRWTFTVVRGDIEAEALSAAEEADLVVLGAGQDVLEAGLRPPSLARLGARARERSVLYVRHRAPSAARLTIAYDGSPGAARALAVAARLAPPGELTVALTGPGADASQALEADAREVLGHDADSVEFFIRPNATAADLCDLSTSVGAGALVMGADNPLLADEAARQRLDEMTCRALVVR